MKRVLTFVIAYALFLGHIYAQWDLSINVKSSNGKALEGAIIKITDTSLQNATDTNGECKFSNVPSGNYTLHVSYLGYQDYSEEFSLNSNKSFNIILQETGIVSEDIVITGVRAKYNQPSTFSILNKEEVEKQNLGLDMPYLLSMEPSVVTTSDAGTGIGYTYMRVRGLDSRKVNVTINGIPYNDAESQLTYWVDLPDMASSVNSIQLQRGLGKSAPGSPAFGASINIETDKIPQQMYVSLDNSVGSYNTIKNTIQAGTGLINKHWFADGRLSRINSDGYIDRGTSNLKSYFAQAGYYSSNSIFRIIAFGGYEETYQAWYGIDSTGINSFGRTFNWAGYYTSNGNEYFYNKQVDHYMQNHIQANYIHSFSDNLQFSTILNYTRGKGYYQEYYDNVPYSDYLLPGTDTADLIGRKWLDNQLFAENTFIKLKTGKFDMTAGVALSRYVKAKHYGELLWAELTNYSVNGYKYYENEGDKTDVSPYIKANYQFATNGNLYLDMNYRYVNYKANGSDMEFAGKVPLALNKTYNFFNPILGFSYKAPIIGIVYATFGISNREPTRGDFVDAYLLSGEPQPEKLYNTEVGIRRILPSLFYELNFYYMDYRNELIKTGGLDESGAPIVKNTGKSYRTGIEFNAGISPVSYVKLKGNISISRNKTDFKDYIDSTWVIKKNVTISFSPGIVAGYELAINPIKNIELAISNKYVGKQYLDNTQDEKRILNAYSVYNIRLSAKSNIWKMKNLEFKLMVNNVFNKKYNSNGYMFGDTPYYYPQALRNYLAGLSIGF